MRILRMELEWVRRILVAVGMSQRREVVAQLTRTQQAVIVEKHQTRIQIAQVAVEFDSFQSLLAASIAIRTRKQELMVGKAEPADFQS